MSANDTGMRGRKRLPDAVEGIEWAGCFERACFEASFRIPHFLDIRKRKDKK